MSDLVDELMLFFEHVGDLYVGGIMQPAWAGFDAQPAALEAMELFLRQYAYERSGASRDYSRAAAEAIRCCSPELAPAQVWAAFGQLIDGRPNRVVNPLAHAPGESRSRCLLCVLRDGPGHRNLVTTARDALTAGNVQAAHAELMSIRGIGPKIASFFLRDVAIRYEIEPAQRRDLLQPVDRWILRFTQILDDDLAAPNVGDWMVRHSGKPELANAGMWYFGARIAPRPFTYTRALHDPDFARQLAQEYVDALKSTVESWG